MRRSRAGRAWPRTGRAGRMRSTAAASSRNSFGSRATASRCGVSRRSGSPTTFPGARTSNLIRSRQRAARVTQPSSPSEARRSRGPQGETIRAGVPRGGSTSTAAGRSPTRPAPRCDRPLPTAQVRRFRCGTSPNTSPQARKRLQISRLAPARQAGGHWFEPSTAHLEVLQTTGCVCGADDTRRARARSSGPGGDADGVAAEAR